MELFLKLIKDEVRNNNDNEDDEDDDEDDDNEDDDNEDDDNEDEDNEDEDVNGDFRVRKGENEVIIRTKVLSMIFIHFSPSFSHPD